MSAIAIRRCLPDASPTAQMWALNLIPPMAPPDFVSNMASHTAVQIPNLAVGFCQAKRTSRTSPRSSSGSRIILELALVLGLFPDPKSRLPVLRSRQRIPSPICRPCFAASGKAAARSIWIRMFYSSVWLSVCGDRTTPFTPLRRSSQGIVPVSIRSGRRSSLLSVHPALERPGRPRLWRKPCGK